MNLCPGCSFHGLNASQRSARNAGHREPFPCPLSTIERERREVIERTAEMADAQMCEEVRRATDRGKAHAIATAPLSTFKPRRAGA